ncbi:hypothetical protein FB381_4668 [Nocardioides albertanoniae]|uniref:Uncharacterized protein n=1 Tax=Nocardioides albertanoniae TaxID=1175486 RepID=A0A543ADZ5_9ACTN|nr:hypothetical protein [Nocardioides albertanoniae]TQL70726.1 hypothetical protein FB381_4668 [Nocardioides albertanoniae]
MSADDSRSDLWHWYEYPVGLVGEITRAFERTLFPFLTGLGGTFVLVLGVGMMADEGMLGDPGVANAVESLLLASLPLLMIAAVVVWAGYASAACLRDVTTSRAIVRATRDGADRHRVPSPEQVVAVIREPGRLLRYFALGTGGPTAVLGVIGVGIAFTRDDVVETLTISAIALAWAAAMVPLAFYVPQWLTAAQERRQKVIAAFWSTEDEANAWKRARQDRSRPRAGSGGFRSADKVIYAATLVALLGFLILQLSVGARCSTVPGSSPAQQCDTTHYGSFIERILGWGFSAFVVAMVIAILLAAGGALFDWRQRRSERNDLRRRLDDMTAERPDDLVLAHHSERHTHPIITMAVILSAFTMIVAAAAYFAGKREDSEVEIFYSPHQDLELSIAAAALALFVIALVTTAVVNVRGREFRNVLMRRWPAGPTWSAGEDGRVLRAKAGPALHAARYKKVGKGKSSQNTAPY